MKRILCFGTVFFVGGIAAAAYNVSLTLAAFAFCALAVFLYQKRCVRYLAVCAVLFAAGFLRCNAYVGAISEKGKAYATGEENIVFTVCDFPDGNRVFARANIGENNTKICITSSDCAALLPGDVCGAHVTFRTSEGSYARYLYGRGVSLCATADKIYKTGQSPSKIYALRRYVKNMLSRLFSGDVRAFVTAVLLGDKSLISDELYRVLRGGGINHIAVVSGMHLSVMIAVLMYAVRALLGQSRAAYVFILAAAVFITLFEGAGASVVRACIMCAMSCAASFLYRENDPQTSLFATTAAMLMFNPCSIYNAGFVLSVLSTLGIVVCANSFSRTLSKKLPPFMAEILSVSLSAQLFVTPALIAYFGEVSLYGIFINTVVFVFSSIMVTVGLLMLAVCKIPLLAGVLSYCVGGAAVLILSVSAAATGFPLSTVRISMLAVVCVAVYAAMIGFLIKRKSLHALAALAAFVIVASVIPKTSGKAAVYIPVSDGSVIVDCGSAGAYLVGASDADDIRYAASKNGITKFSAAFADEAGINACISLARDNMVRRVYCAENTVTVARLDALFREMSEGAVTVLCAGENIHTPFGTAQYLPSAAKQPPLCLVRGNKKYLYCRWLDKNDLAAMRENGERHCANEIYADGVCFAERELFDTIFKEK